jgi:hypothetical protein
MKFFAALIITLLLSFISGLYLPWWGVAVVAFIVALLIHQRAWKAFLSGFLALFILWMLLALWRDVPNDSILSGKIGELLGVGKSPFLVLLITSLLGGIVAGFAAWSGSALRSLKKR